MIGRAPLPTREGRVRRWQGPVTLILLAVTAVGAAVVGLCLGAVPVPLSGVMSAWVGEADPLTRAIVLDLRLPRVVLAAVAGGALALAGALMQGLFRNPLADPGLLGVSAGAGAAVAGAMVFVPAAVAVLGPAGTPIVAFGGGLIAVAGTLGLARLAGAGVAPLLLAGIAINAVGGTLTSLAVLVANDARLRDLTFWLMGGLGAASWPIVLGALAPVGVGALLAVPLARPLDLLALGEVDAAALGVEPARIERWATIATALLVGGAVAAAGGVAFVGLVAPHLVRLAIGSSHRWLLPGSALAGATLVGAADVVARVAAPPVELPLGLVTSLVGAPFFLALLLTRRGAA
jgi:iron complex transport system permease protein